VNYQFEEVKVCPICGAEGKHEISSKAREDDIIIDVYGCPNCHSSYHNPRMTDESLHEYYQKGVYAKGYKHNNVGEVNRAEKRSKIIQGLNIKPGYKRALDVGCAQGYLLQEFEKIYGCETVGFDLYEDPEAILEIVTDRDQIEGPFDLITCMHVLEHVGNPIELLGWMGGLLETDGVLMIEVPIRKEVNLPHPVIFSLSSLPVIMFWAGIENYTYIVNEDVAIMVGVK